MNFWEKYAPIKCNDRNNIKRTTNLLKCSPEMLGSHMLFLIFNLVSIKGSLPKNLCKLGVRLINTRKDILTLL